ncbi:MAG: hypothetical protein H0V46_03110 [Sphingomonas sp.]|nr:hypothetical protein [Sphingomonas sp.]
MTDQEGPPKGHDAVVFHRPKYVPREGWISAQHAFENATTVLRSESRAEEKLLAAMLDGSLKASTRCMMDDYDVYPVPEKPPLKKQALMRGIWFSAEGHALGLLSCGLRSAAKVSKVTLDFQRSTLVVVRPPDAPVYTDPDDGRVTITPPERRVHYKIEVQGDSLEALLESQKNKKSAPVPPEQSDPDSDNYRVKLSTSQWNKVLSPLTQLCREGRLEDKFGILGRGDKRPIKEEILRLLEAEGHRASTSTLNRRCNDLIAMNEQARKAESGEGSNGST